MKVIELFEKKNISDETAWVIAYSSEKIILGKRAPSVRNPNLWNFFGGHVDPGETPAQAAAREMEEEVSVKLNTASLKQIAKIGNATYFAAKVSPSAGFKTSKETSKISAFKLTDLPDNLHSKTENFFSQLDALFK